MGICNVCLLQAYVFKGNSEECAAFLVNNDNERNATMHYENSTYELPPESVSILPDCKIVAFNTAKVHLKSRLLVVYVDQNIQFYNTISM